MGDLGDLAFLVESGQFRVIHREGYANDERAMIVLESPRARIKIELERGTRVVHVGASDAPVSWASQVDGNTVWFVDNALLNFIEHRGGVAKSDASPAERLRAHLDAIVDAIADRPAEWWRAYEAYRAERLAEMRRDRR